VQWSILGLCAVQKLTGGGFFSRICRMAMTCAGVCIPKMPSEAFDVSGV
jgi:hypothetical protein